MKLGKLALIGALTFSGFTAIEMSKPTSQAAAAYSDPLNDDWGFKTIVDLQNSEESTYQPDWKVGNLITGDTFYLTQHFGREHFGAQMKIFKIHTNGTLERFQTIEPEFIPGTEIWQTPITDSYTSGTYVAAIKYRGEFTYSNQFTIN
ncbi:MULTISPECIES: DUF5065 family protein [Bacillus cereus group]|uniref:DUF5065 family protein n=1 Tax=Bacillus cereus group TaxID=86661 RepID=UPI0005CB6224|nr:MULTISPECIES: DUF5065 family protein [Bacillus cereus group]KIZ27646.1 hypothetical protein SK30_24920 [Bacillus cereus]MBJ8127333.1 DUF5065 family protein [Bacillus cereus]MCU4861891.1 DUF5065 family protein [Bacillus cereus]PGB45728.1 DUF5065 domain-containing protein [Bacillus anthracis]